LRYQVAIRPILIHAAEPSWQLQFMIKPVKVVLLACLSGQDAESLISGEMA